MIDGKTIWFSGILLVAMITMAVLRLSLLPGSLQPLGGFGLFAAPATLLIMMAMAFLFKLEPEETRPSWRRWSGKWIGSWGVFLTLLQVFVLARSLGLVWFSPGLAPRFFLVLIGIMFMMTGNIAPKAPSRPQQGSFELDPWRQNRLLRFAGKLLFGLGLSFALGGVLLPLDYWRSVFFCLMLAALAAGIGYGIKLRHEPRDKALGDAG